MTETIATVLNKIKSDLDWRGPNNKTLGHIILSREQGEHAHRVMLDIIIERDALLFEAERLREELRAVLGHVAELRAKP